MKLKERALSHLRQNLGLYAVLVGIYAAGAVFGAFGVSALQPENQQELAGFLQRSFTALTANIPSGALGNLIWENLKVLLATYVLGMTVIGMPLIFVLVFTRGFVLGFAVGFMLQVRAWQGILVTVLGITPPALLHIPALIITAVWAVNFSFALIRGGKRGQERTLGRQFAAYSAAVLLMVVLGSLAALLQSYLSPLMLKAILSYTDWIL